MPIIDPPLYPAETLYPSESLYPSDGTETPDPPVLGTNTLRVVENPPMRQYVIVTTPNGHSYRWGEDELGADTALANLSDSDSVPGGYKEMTCTLSRKPQVDYSDLEMGTLIEVFGAGRMKVGEYRLERAPRSSGDVLAIDPAAYGFQSHLNDDESAQEIFLDKDLSAWGEPSAERRLQLINAGIRLMAATSVGLGSVEFAALTAAVINDFTNVTTVASDTEAGEADYDAGGVDIGKIMYDFKQLTNVAPTPNPDWENNLAIGKTDTFTLNVLGTDHDANASALQQTLSTSGPGYKFARVRDRLSAASEGSQLKRIFAWTLAVFGSHGLPVQGVWPTEIGILASDIIAYALAHWAPLLNFTTGAKGTIRPTTFAIPHIVFKEPGSIGPWIEEANRFELNEWAVWNERTFYLNPRGEREGRKRWVARLSEANFQENGQSIERVRNGVVIQYQSVDGSTRTIGPPNSGLEATDARLADEDPLNPANLMGVRRWIKIAISGVSTAEGAVRVGELYLLQSKEFDGSGSANLVGYVEDEHGARWPYYCVHSGDLIRFPDSAQPGWRYIINASRNRSDRSIQVDLDAPPDSQAALLERLNAVLIGTGA